MTWSKLALGVLACVAVIGAVFGVLQMANDGPFGSAMIAGVILLAGWMMVPQRATATPKWFVLFLLAMTFSSVLPNAASFGVQGLAIIGAYIAWLATPALQRRGSAVFVWSTIIIAYWLLLMLHSNTPSLDVGLLGFRKSVYCLVGLLIGLVMHRSLLRQVERSVVWVLTFAMAVSVALHELLPSLEATLVERSADIYTSLIGGESRMQGVFAGPFHAATGALILIVWAVARFRSHKVMALIVLTVGSVGLYSTLVRTAYIALALALIAMVFASPTAGKVLRRASGLVAIAIVGFAAITAVNPGALEFFAAIVEFSDDTRFTGRLAGYQHGLDLFARSPLIGWGAGSAGDTLGPSYVGGEHVTSHNVLLKIAVEGGLLGLVLWAGLIVCILRALPRSSPTTPLAVGMLTVLFGMGLTGSSLESLPLTFFAFLFVGISVTDRPPLIPTFDLQSQSLFALSPQEISDCGSNRRKGEMRNESICSAA